MINTSLISHTHCLSNSFYSLIKELISSYSWYKLDNTFRITDSPWPVVLLGLGFWGLSPKCFGASPEYFIKLCTHLFTLPASMKYHLQCTACAQKSSEEPTFSHSSHLYHQWQSEHVVTTYCGQAADVVSCAGYPHQYGIVSDQEWFIEQITEEESWEETAIWPAIWLTAIGL